MAIPTKAEVFKVYRLSLGVGALRIPSPLMVNRLQVRSEDGYPYPQVSERGERAALSCYEVTLTDMIRNARIRCGDPGRRPGQEIHD